MPIEDVFITVYVIVLIDVSEVLFAPDAHASNSDTSAGLTVSEYIAIGICSILLGLIYVASVFLYLHIRRRRRKEGLEKDLEKIDEQSLAPGEEGIVKNNPLLSLGRHFTGPDTAFSDSGSSDDLTPDILQHQDDNRKKGNVSNCKILSLCYMMFCMKQTMAA